MGSTSWQSDASNFLHMDPKINVGEYDYIVFDMPPVSPTSPTPRLAAHMDLVLLVLEAERTGQGPPSARVC